AVDAAVTEMATEVNANAGNPGAQMKAVAQADFDLAQLALRARNPSATLITDANQGILIRTVRAKAALEANGKPQTWTPQERMALIELANDGRLRNAYIVDD